MIAVALMTVLFVCFLYHNFIGKRSYLPPGPSPLPYVGNLLQLDRKNPTKTFAKWAKEYGPVFTVWLGNCPNVVVTDYKLIKEALLKTGDVFCGRPQIEIFKISQGGQWHGLVNSTVLRNIGVGQNIMEQKIHQQIDRMIMHVHGLLGDSNSKVLCVDDLELQFSIGNIISNIVIGHNFSRETYDILRNIIDRQFEINCKPHVALLISFPWLRHIPFLGGFGFKDMKAHFDGMFQFMSIQIAESKRNHPQVNEKASSYTQAYIQEMQMRQSNGNSQDTFSEYQLASAVTDLWVAGMDTTVATLGWALMFMIHYPEIQEKCYQEISHVMAARNGDILTMADRTNTPYFAATVMEIQRKANILPINLPRSLLRDAEFAGFKFKKDTAFTFNIANVLCDPGIYSDPEKFLPERFLDRNQNGLKKLEEFVPFSLGKRSCIGESLARMELYLIIGTILQKFRISVKQGCILPTLEPQIRDFP